MQHKSFVSYPPLNISIPDMLESMTGFGTGEYASDGTRAVVEMKSVNSRFLEFTFRLPQGVKNYESDFKNFIQNEIGRGKVNVNIQLDYLDEDYTGTTIDPRALKNYSQLLTELKDKAGVQGEITIDHLLQFRDIFVSREISDEEEHKLYEIVKKALALAVVELKETRRKEGEALGIDLYKRMQQIRETCNAIKGLAEQRAPEARQNLDDRIRKLVSRENVDMERLEMEIAILVDKMDISEELVRMDSHLKFFVETIEELSSNGRKLNFLLQEMHREVNTMGVKAYSSEISYHVVNMKESLENIREQVQNIA
ncbi:MAG: YicC/YloC family endoribonuclease [Balneolales bacterium]